MIKQGQHVIEPTQFKFSVIDNWWDRVTKTYCDKCKKLTPTHHYQGHFMCNVCGSVTGFWIIPPGFPDPKQPVHWNAEATALVTVECEMIL